MGCSQPKEFRTGLRIVGSFLKVKLYYNMCGTQVLLPLPDRRGLIRYSTNSGARFAGSPVPANVDVRSISMKMQNAETPSAGKFTDSSR